MARSHGIYLEKLIEKLSAIYVDFKSEVEYYGDFGSSDIDLIATNYDGSVDIYEVKCSATRLKGKARKQLRKHHMHLENEGQIVRNKFLYVGDDNIILIYKSANERERGESSFKEYAFVS